MSDRTDPPAVVEAKARAAAARARLGETIATIRQRVSPQALAHGAADTIKDKATALASDVGETARRRPAVAGVAAAAALLLLARRPIAALIRRATRDDAAS